MSTSTTLLNVAENLARKRGFDAFSYADLSKAVGISKASIHHHFPTKADLAFGLIKRYREEFFAELGRIASKHATASDRLNAYLTVYKAALCDGDKVCLCVAFSAGRDSFGDNVLAEIKQFHEDSIRWLTEVFEKGLSDGTLPSYANPKEEAVACLATVEGAQLLARAAKDPKLFDQATARLKSLID